jgi:adenosylmethionine-8-amino-7-oxononanoate aminotransferase
MEHYATSSMIFFRKRVILRPVGDIVYILPHVITEQQLQKYIK